MFTAKFGKVITRWKIQKFYKENNVKWGRPIRLFNLAIANETNLNVLRVAFKQRLRALLADGNSRIFYIDETSFNA